MLQHRRCNVATQPGSDVAAAAGGSATASAGPAPFTTAARHPVGVADRGAAARMSSFFSKERLKALADQAKAGASQLQSQAQQGLQRMQTQRRTSSREGNKLLRQPERLASAPPPLRGSDAP